MGASYVARPEKGDNPLNHERSRLSRLFMAMAEQAEINGAMHHYEPHRILKTLGMPSSQVDVLFGQQLLPGQRRDALRQPVGYELVIAKLQKNEIGYRRFRKLVEQPLDKFFSEQQQYQYITRYRQTCLDQAARVQLVDQHLGGRLTDCISARQLETPEQRSQAVLGIAFSLGQQFQTEYDSYRRSMVGSLGINIAQRPLT